MFECMSEEGMRLCVYVCGMGVCVSANGETMGRGMLQSCMCGKPIRGWSDLEV